MKILNEYIHVDNGGYTFEMEIGENCPLGLKIGNSFFGYAENTMVLSYIGSKELRHLATKFIEAAAKLDEITNKEEENAKT